QVVDEIEDIDGVYNPESDASLGVPQLNVAIDHDTASLYGLTADAIQSQIEMRFIGQVVTQYHEEGQEIDVSLMYPEGTKQTISDLEDMKISAPSGTTLALSDLAVFTEQDGPVTHIRHKQQAQMNVTSELANRDLNNVVKDVETQLAKEDFIKGYHYTTGGEAEDMAASFSDLTMAL